MLKANGDSLTLPLFTCATEGHEYEQADTGYYKHNAKNEQIKSKVYRMIFCIKCGDNREICVVDRTISQKTKRKAS